MEWHIALTQPGQDSRAEKALINARYRVYRPIIPAVRSGAYGRSYNSVKSLFPGYVLVRDDCAQGWRPLHNASGIRVHGPLMTRNNHTEFVTITEDSEEFKIIKEVEAECWLKKPPEEPQINVGDEVRVPVDLNDGTVMELIGNIERLDDGGRVSILVWLLGCTRITITRERLLQHMATGGRVPSGERLSAA